jgi:hypothetical protein
VYELLPTAFGYGFLRGVRQYSAGVVAASGYSLRRVQFTEPVPLEAGLRRAAEIVAEAGLPPGALSAFKLRTPTPFTEVEFTAFNRRYVSTLGSLGVQLHDGVSTVARTNVCPATSLVAGPSVHAFCFAEPAAAPGRDFVVSGSAEVPEGLGSYRDHIVAPGDVTAAALLHKARFVVAEMATRLASLGISGTPPQVVQAYSVHEVHAVLAGPVARFAPQRGVLCHLARPPVVDLEYEMDCRTISVERLEEFAATPSGRPQRGGPPLARRTTRDNRPVHRARGGTP